MNKFLKLLGNAIVTFIFSILAIWGGVKYIPDISDAYTKYFVEPQNNIESLKNRVNNLEENLARRDSNIIDASMFSTIDKELSNKVDYKTFNQSVNSLGNSVKSIMNSIETLKGAENLSNQIIYWKNEVETIKRHICYSSDKECQLKKDTELKDARDNLFKLQSLLPR